MLDVERRILDIDKTLCENMDLMDFQNVTRALVSQNLLSQSRNLIEHIAVRAYSEGKDVQVNWDTINAGLDYIIHNGKYLFLRKFHNFLQESKSHYTHNIFYTAITRSKRLLKIYWSPETQEKVINSFELSDNKRDARKCLKATILREERICSCKK